MMLGCNKYITHNIIWANQKTLLCIIGYAHMYVFSGICHSIGCHFMHSVDRLIEDMFALGIFKPIEIVVMCGIILEYILS